MPSNVLEVEDARNMQSEVEEYLTKKYGNLDNVPDYVSMRKNHVSCVAGGDTKQRLYMERKSDKGPDLVLYFCHNCGLGGSLQVKGFGVTNYRRRADTKFNGVATSPEQGLKPGVYAPDQFGEKEIEEWSTDARNWWTQWASAFGQAQQSEASGKNGNFVFLRRMGLLARRFGIVFKPFDNKLVFPTLDMKGQPVGWQERRISGHGPKYITYRRFKEDAPSGSFVSARRTPVPMKRVLVLVEDYISACAIAYAGKADALALMGTHIDAERLLTLSGDYDMIIVWLDNDNETVKKHAHTMLRKLEMFGKCKADIVHATNDPKRHSRAEIVSIIQKKVESHVH